MKVKQAKLAQALRGESSNIIDETKFELTFDKGMLHAKLRYNPKNIGPFVVFPANIAFLEYHEEVTGENVQSEVKPLVEAPKAKAKK